MSAKSYFALQFQVQRKDGIYEYAASIELEDVTFGMELLTDDMALTLQLSTLHVDKVKILQCAYGYPSAEQIKLEINNSFRVAKPFINTYMKGHPFQLPTEFGGFKLEALTLA